MNLRLTRRVSSWLIAMLLFTHATLSLAECPRDRATLAQAITQAAENPCCATASPAGYESLYGNRCVAHCTSDLQAAGLATMVVRAPADVPVLLVAEVEQGFEIRPRVEPEPPGKLPHRILFQSFQI